MLKSSMWQRCEIEVPFFENWTSDSSDQYWNLNDEQIILTQCSASSQIAAVPWVQTNLWVTLIEFYQEKCSWTCGTEGSTGRQPNSTTASYTSNSQLHSVTSQIEIWKPILILDLDEWCFPFLIHKRKVVVLKSISKQIYLSWSWCF